MKKYDEIMDALENIKTRSAWSRGVKEYAFDFMRDYKEAIEYAGKEAENISEFKKMLLNGAHDWKQFSWGGCSLCSDYAIAIRLCTPSELKKTEKGYKKPNTSEEWLDVQSRALYQAFELLKRCAM